MGKIRICTGILMTLVSLPLGIVLSVASVHGPAAASYIAWILAPSLFLGRLGVKIPIFERATIPGTLLLVSVQFFYWLMVLTLIGHARRRRQSLPH